MTSMRKGRPKTPTVDGGRDYQPQRQRSVEVTIAPIDSDGYTLLTVMHIRSEYAAEVEARAQTLLLSPHLWKASGFSFQAVRLSHERDRTRGDGARRV